MERHMTISTANVSAKVPVLAHQLLSDRMTPLYVFFRREDSPFLSENLSREAPIEMEVERDKTETKEKDLC